ncbi:MAG: hypothetical protein SF051_03090 [Elusimicrobiota bacterium]|nr:hypothetical protein [Elusimicrobiota bacterium]
MRPGSWLQPRHGSEEAFNKDFPTWQPGSGLEVACPGCGASVRLSRKSPAGKTGGWCKKCNRGVSHD